MLGRGKTAEVVRIVAGAQDVDGSVGMGKIHTEVGTIGTGAGANGVNCQPHPKKEESV